MSNQEPAPGDESSSMDHPGPIHTWDSVTIADVQDVLRQVQQDIDNPELSTRLQWVVDGLTPLLPPDGGSEVMVWYSIAFQIDSELNAATPEEVVQEAGRDAVLDGSLNPEVTVRQDHICPEAELEG